MRLGFKRYILIYLGAIFLMSHIICNNVGAVDTVIDLSGYELVYSNDEPAFNCNYSNGDWVRGVRICDLTPSRPMARTVATTNTFHFLPGDIVNFDLFFYQNAINGFTWAFEFRSYVPGNNNNLLSFNLTDSTLSVDDGYSNYGNYLINGNVISRLYNVSYVSLNEADKSIGFATGTGNFIYYKSSPGQQADTSVDQSVMFRIANVKVYRFTGSTENAEQAQATQNAADNSETVAGNNSENEATTNLIGAFGGFVTALGNLQATNCNVTLAWPSSLGGNMNVNICQNKNYAGNIVSIFGSLTMIVFYIPLALKLLSMIYNEIRSFTNG